MDVSTMSRKEIAAAKLKIMYRLVKANKSNAKISEDIMSKFGSGISSSSMASAREELGLSFPNRKKRTKRDSVLVLPISNTSPLIMQAAKHLTALMQNENIEWITINRTGTVKIAQVQHTEFTV